MSPRAVLVVGLVLMVVVRRLAAVIMVSVRRCAVAVGLVYLGRQQQAGAVENENHVPHAVERRGQGGR